jgi:hypothetical protein
MAVIPDPHYQKTHEQLQKVEQPPADKTLELVKDEPYLTPDELSETIRKEKPASNNFTAFATKPRRAAFDAQLRNEEIALLLRRHLVTQLSKIAIVTTGLFFPILMLSSPFLQFMPINYKLATIIGWYLVLFGYALESFLTWFFNVFIITNRRVIDVDFYSMVHKDIASAKLESIQDMSVVTTGVFASLIDFGTLYVQTAGQNPKIEFEDIPHPSKVTKILNELIAKKKRMVGRRFKSV